MNQITDNLYLGNLHSSKIDNLKENGITKVLSVIDKFVKVEYKESDNIKHKVIRIGDSESNNIIQYFGECLNFINGDEKVLVHCSGGISRSATVVIAYIMLKKKMKYLEAFNFVLERRPVGPNWGFKSQLEMFEKELIKNEYDIDKIKFGEIKWYLSNIQPKKVKWRNNIFRKIIGFKIKNINNEKINQIFLL